MIPSVNSAAIHVPNKTQPGWSIHMTLIALLILARREIGDISDHDEEDYDDMRHRLPHHEFQRPPRRIRNLLEFSRSPHSADQSGQLTTDIRKHLGRLNRSAA